MSKKGENGSTIFLLHPDRAEQLVQKKELLLWPGIHKIQFWNLVKVIRVASCQGQAVCQGDGGDLGILDADRPADFSAPGNQKRVFCGPAHFFSSDLSGFVEKRPV